MEDVYGVYKKTLYIENTHLIDVSLAVYKSKDYGETPVWLNPYGSSGIGKTTSILPLIKLAFDWKNEDDKENAKYGIFFIDDLTKATFGSGSRGRKKEDDLGHWLENRRCFMIISDLSPILTMDFDSRNAIFGKLRTIFDGYIKIDTGEKSRYYKNIHLNLLAFATKEVRDKLELHQSLGTREISYELPSIDNVVNALLKKDTKDGKEERCNVVKDFLDDLGEIDYESIDKREWKRKEKFITNLAIKLARWRAVAMCDRDGYLTTHTEQEYPMRVKNQLEALFKTFIGMGIKEAVATKRIMEIVDGSGNPIRKEIMRSMFVLNDDFYHNPVQVTVKELVAKLNISPRTILTQLMILRDMKMVAPIVSNNDLFSINTKWFPIVREEDYL